MKKRNRLIILAGSATLFLAAATLAVLRYVPWHKLIKVPTSNEMAFIRKDPVKNSVPNTLIFDFEVDSSKRVPNGIYEGVAHSGRYSAKAFGKGSFSVNIVRTAGEIGLKNLDGVAMSAWVYVLPTEEEVNGSLVFAANNSVGANLSWKGVSFSGPMIPEERWTKISGYFDLSDVRLRKDDQIQLYFWNNSETDILVDDFYFVFGAPRDRIGDTTFVDMTGETGYRPRFNSPPFPSLLLQNLEIGNGVFLATEGEIPFGEITPSDQVFAGNFITRPAEIQSMLVIHPDGKPELFHYCPERTAFISVPLECPPEIFPLLSGQVKQTARFLSGGDQLFVAGEKGLALIAFEGIPNPCNGNRAPVRIRVLWRSDTPFLAGESIRNDRHFTCGDFNGDGTDELLLFLKEGSWKILRFSSGGEWNEMADGKEYKIRRWNPALGEFRAIAGTWLENGTDQVLTVFRDGSTKKAGYMMFRYRPGDEKFTETYPDSQGGVGITAGIDTLKPEDQFMYGRFQPGRPPSFLRYNRDWRFDLKEIRFNDTAFQILASVGFTGYPGDRNPKYYEILKLHAGNWTDPFLTSVLVIGRNCLDPGYSGGPCRTYEDNPDLPPMLQIYSFTQNRP